MEMNIYTQIGLLGGTLFLLCLVLMWWLAYVLWKANKRL